MKIQLDTNLKIVRLEESVNLNDLFEMLNKIFPDNGWKEYKLETSVLSNWVNPIVIDRRPYPVWPWYQQQYTTGVILTSENKSENGIYNLSIND